MTTDTTETGADETGNICRRMEEHDRMVETLTQKWVGKAALARGRAIPDPSYRKRWYANRIAELGAAEGRNEMRMCRCRRTDTPAHKKYEALKQELYHVREGLILELLQV